MAAGSEHHLVALTESLKVVRWVQKWVVSKDFPTAERWDLHLVGRLAGLWDHLTAVHSVHWSAGVMEVMWAAQSADSWSESMAGNSACRKVERSDSVKVGSMVEQTASRMDAPKVAW